MGFVKKSMFLLLSYVSVDFLLETQNLESPVLILSCKQKQTQNFIGCSLETMGLYF